MLRVLGIVPARGGSKGIPRKNIRMLAGKPLLQYTAEAALGARYLTRVILSTEDEEIAAVGRSCALEVPFLRPVELARDDTPTLAVVQHAVGVLEGRGDRFDAICLLQPTAPLRTSDVIDRCILLLSESNADSVITILQVPDHYNPHWVYFMGSDQSLRLSMGEGAPISRRQDLPKAFHREGSVYVTRRDVVVNNSSLYGNRTVGFAVDGRPSVNLDTADDWMRAEAFLLKQPGIACSGPKAR